MISQDRVPFVPPFGVVFTAWADDAVQHAWVQRACAVDATVQHPLYQVLAQTRQRGFDIDWMTPTLAQAANVIDTLSSSRVPEHVRHTLERLR
jgi:hypothetical protein